MLLGSMVKSSAIMVEKICSVQPKSVLLSIRLHTTAEDEQQSHVSIATYCFIIIIDSPAGVSARLWVHRLQSGCHIKHFISLLQWLT